MGCWGIKPFENDGAADWFSDLWDNFQVPQKIEETLRIEDIEDYHEEIRAAAYVLVQFGDVYRWPIDDIDRQCDLAANRLEELLKLEAYANDQLRQEIKEEIAILRARISKDFQKK